VALPEGASFFQNNQWVLFRRAGNGLMRINRGFVPTSVLSLFLGFFWGHFFNGGYKYYMHFDHCMTQNIYGNQQLFQPSKQRPVRL
jgi:hypothetical protein